MENLLPIINQNYNLPNLALGEVLQEKGGRIVLTLVSNDKKYILKIADRSKTKEQIEKDTFVFSFLRDKNFIGIPLLIQTKNEERYMTINEQFAYLLEYVEGKNLEGTKEDWAALGKLTATLHSFNKYPIKTLFAFKNEKPKLIEIAQKLPFKDEYIALVNSLPDFDTLSQTLIHTDIGTHNAIKSPDGSIVLIDWDDCGLGTRVLDLGFPLLSQFLNGKLVFEKDKAKAFYDEYFSQHVLSKEEKLHIFDAGIFFALLYMPHVDIEKCWAKIQFALANKEEINSIFV